MEYLRFVIDALYVILAVVTVIVFTKRGFIDSVFRFGRTIAAGILAYFFGPRLSDFIYEKLIYRGILGLVTEKIEAFLMSTAEAINIEGMIDALPFLVKQLIDADAIKEKYGVTEGNFEEIAADFAASVSQPISSLLSNLIAYVAVFFVALLLLWIVFKILDGLFKLPGLNAINKVLGAILGVIAAGLLLAALTYVLGVLVGVFGSTSMLNQLVEASTFFRVFNNEISIFDLF